MQSGKSGMSAPAGGYSAPAGGYSAPAGGYYAPALNYAPAPNYVNQQHRVETAPPVNPYVFTDKVNHEPDCRYRYGVSPERRRKNRVANALAAAFVVCWCCTWPCHGPCCCGL